MLQRRLCGLRLGLFLCTTFSLPQDASVYEHRCGERLVVVRSALSGYLVDYVLMPVLLAEDLKIRLVVRRKIALRGILYGASQEPHHQIGSRLRPPVQEHCRDHRLRSVRDHRDPGFSALVLLAASHLQELVEPYVHCGLCERSLADYLRAELCKESFVLVRVSPVQFQSHNSIQNGVAQELQALVSFAAVSQVIVGVRAVGKSAFQQRFILKFVAYCFFCFSV